MSPVETAAAERLDVPGLRPLLAGVASVDPDALVVLACEALKRCVHRVTFLADGRAGSVIVKRTSPEIARRNRLVSDRWLPDAGMPDLAPATHGILPGADPETVWLVSEDAGTRTLADAPREAARAAAALGRIARLHRRFAVHAVLGEVRLRGGELGPAFLLGNLRDALRALTAVQRAGLDRPDAHGDGDASSPVPASRAARAATLTRLRARLVAMIEDAPRRAEILARAGGAETLLHGDLWLENLVEVPRGEGALVRLIDWDHAAVGPPLYDLSTFLYRYPPSERRALFARYAEALGADGWWLPGEDELAIVAETCEHARIANRVIWPALEALRGGGEHALAELDEVAGWFDALEPLFP
jgi:hypothetical protein